MPNIHSNPLKIPVVEIQEGLPVSSLMMPINLIQYRRPVGMFKNRHFASMTLKVFSKDKISVGIL